MKNLCIFIALLLLTTSLFGCNLFGGETTPTKTSPTTTLPAPTTTIPATVPTTVPTTTAPQPYVGSALGPVQWNLTVTKVNSSGQIRDEGLIFTIHGEFRDDGEHHIRLDIDISFEDHLDYRITKSDGGYYAPKIGFQEYGYYSASAICRKKISGTEDLMYFAIDPVKGFAIFLLKGDFYLGSVDSFADPAEIYAHFYEFIESKQ